MSDYKFELPFPPSVNRWKSPFKGRMILTRAGRDYRAKVHELMQSYNLNNENLSERLSVSLKLHPPTNRKFDVDNFSKSLFDALTTCGFWLDDELVDKLHVEKCAKVEGGKVEVEVSVL